MVKDLNSIQSQAIKRPDFDTCKMKFREATVNIANDFANSSCDIWLWLKKRLDFVFEEGVVVSRQLNETKQKSYISSGAAAIWNESTQGAIGIVREYIPGILDKLPEAKCEKCGNPFRVYSNGLKVVSGGWKKFWTTKAHQINALKIEQQNAMVRLFRDARSKFKYTLNQSCYGDNGEVLQEFHKDVFFPELLERIQKVYNVAFAEYVETVINGLPDMVSSRCFCAACHAPVQLCVGNEE